MTKLIRNQERSEYWAAQSTPKVHQCYMNSFNVLPYLGDGGLYHEGFVILTDYNVPLEHGWLTSPEVDGIIDVTILDIATEYCPVKSWSLDNLIAHLSGEKHPSLPVGFLDVLDTSAKYIDFMNRILWSE